ncbi:hypothetical protein BB934_31790 (plasmid) [Microvirga ossetica]|uniref:Uncharacterized protein n=1 Tax=Microvirga ossetica TaxID=1882682 RepID=A0A1B2ESM1_9HYPH|nr:hypothetical protein BB934_31790 [Microvirga ossetica]
MPPFSWTIMPKGSINILSWQLTDDGASGIVPRVPDDPPHPEISMLPRFETILMMYGADSTTNRRHHGGWQRKGPAREPEFQGGPMNSQPMASVIPALGQVNSPSLSDC